MKNFIQIIVFTTLMLALFSGVFYLGYAYAATHVVGINAAATWDAPTTNTDGSTLTDLAGFTIVATDNGSGINPDDPANILNSMDVNDPNATEAPLISLIGPLGDGEYRLWINAFDVNGNYGPYSDKVVVKLDSLAPSNPLNLQVIRNAF